MASRLRVISGTAGLWKPQFPKPIRYQWNSDDLKKDALTANQHMGLAAKTRDEIMARAVATVAHQNGLSELVDLFLGAHPDAAQDYTAAYELKTEMTSRAQKLDENMVFRTERPAEVPQTAVYEVNAAVAAN